jgi:hypothetical protein
VVLAENKTSALFTTPLPNLGHEVQECMGTLKRGMQVIADELIPQVQAAGASADHAHNAAFAVIDETSSAREIPLLYNKAADGLEELLPIIKSIFDLLEQAFAAIPEAANAACNTAIGQVNILTAQLESCYTVLLNADEMVQVYTATL